MSILWRHGLMERDSPRETGELSRMRLGKLFVYFETSPAIKLLHARSAPFVIDFLDRQFKQSGRIAIPHSDLLAALIAYLEELQDTHPNALIGKPDVYISDWCSRDTRWLQRFLEAGRDEPVYQLTPHTEDVFVFLDRVLNQDLGFVGTESRLKLVIETLSDIVVGSSDDPETKLGHLREERDRLQAEIEQIESDGTISRYQPAQIRERFSTAVSLLRQLQGDFRAVEDSFRDITSQVQQRQTGGNETRGRILEFALDAEDLLKQEDQGVSFYEFVRLILSPSQTERLEKIIREVRRIPELDHQQEGLETIRNMITLLQNEADKVMRTNQRLSATLRRLLDVRAHAERQRVAQLLRDLQGLAAVYAGEPDSEEIGLSLDLDMAVESPLRRTFWIDPPRFAAVDLSDFEPDADERMAAFQQLAALKRLDWHGMRDRIRHMLAIENAPTLGDLLAVHPAEAGVVEVIGYLQIAAEEGHLIEPRSTETVVISSDSPTQASLAVTIPRVTFVPARSNGHAR
ncbi:MAG: DUF3375 domain-containing protein [Planctomycetaceae bacterium]